jgi:hypothetical protein
VVLQGMQGLFLSSHRRNEKHAGGARGLAGRWRELAEAAARDPGAFFPDPRPPAELESRRRRELGAGRVEDLRFPSRYAPGRDIAARMLQRYPDNATAHARHLRHAEAGHPALIWVHGWGMGSYRLESRVLGARSLFDLGLDIYLYVQPYHAARMPPGVRFAGTMHPSTAITRTNEAFLQTAWEIRSLAAHHRQQNAGAPCGVMGWSLGGYVAALLAAVAPELSFAISMIPVADVPALLWSWGEGTAERRRAEAAGITFEEFCESMAIHAPLARPLALPRRGGPGDPPGPHPGPARPLGPARAALVPGQPHRALRPPGLPPGGGGVLGQAGRAPRADWRRRSRLEWSP